MKIGIVGTGRIAARFLEESKYVEGLKVVAIYNRHIESVRWFVKQNQIDEKEKVLMTDDWSLLIESVDAVYIATPHETHVSYAKAALEKGVHVLCEKPMALTKAEAEDLFEIAHQNNCVCMEAIKTAYCPGFARIRELIKSGVIGKVHDIDSTFTKIGTAAGREMWGPYGGSFIELGSYVLLPIVKLYGTEELSIIPYSLQSVLGTDSYTKMTFIYPNGVATVKTGLGIKSEGELIISGDDGYIRVPSPWWLTKRIEVHHENPNQIEVYEEEFLGSGLRYEILAFIKQIQEVGKSHLENGLSEKESIWLAEKIQKFVQNRSDHAEWSVDEHNCDVTEQEQLKKIKIWAHRGCSMEYPENTLLAFQKAADIQGITGIELDVQLTKDKKVVVIHDEKVDRTTNGTGNVCDYTLQELRKLYITKSNSNDIYYMSEGNVLHIPTLQEVFDLLAPYCKNRGLRINIELKNSLIPYEGMEQQVINLVQEYDLEDYIIYSSFYHASMKLIKQIDPNAQVGFLAVDYHRFLEGLDEYGGNAIHPGQVGMPLNLDAIQSIQERGIAVRMWNGNEPFYGQCRNLPEFDLRKYYRLGATDIFTNVPERYCKR